MSQSIKRLLLTTQDVRQKTGWSQIKVRNLIASGKLKAINTSCGPRPYWEIPEDALEALLSGDAQPSKPESEKPLTRRQRIDAGVPKVFG